MIFICATHIYSPHNLHLNIYPPTTIHWSSTLLLAYFQIPPVKTALKLAMFGQNSALMHLCAMALKIAYLLKSSTPKNHTIKYLLDSMPSLRYSIEARKSKKSKSDFNCGILCSDFSYDRDDTPGDLQMSNPSQFHLSNLLLLTLTEKAIKDKQYMPLWWVPTKNQSISTLILTAHWFDSGIFLSLTSDIIQIWVASCYRKVGFTRRQSFWHWIVAHIWTHSVHWLE